VNPVLPDRPEQGRPSTPGLWTAAARALAGFKPRDRTNDVSNALSGLIEPGLALQSFEFTQFSGPIIIPAGSKLL
jgi:hypothetical protein